VVPQHVLGVVYVLMFLLAVVIHGRQMEWTARLDFLWQIQVRINICHILITNYRSVVITQAFMTASNQNTNAFLYSLYE